jgi:F0F1-type ATP synthase membrane subunit a
MLGTMYDELGLFAMVAILSTGLYGLGLRIRVTNAISSLPRAAASVVAFTALILQIMNLVCVAVAVAEKTIGWQTPTASLRVELGFMVLFFFGTASLINTRGGRRQAVRC